MIPRPSLDGLVSALLFTDSRHPQVQPSPEEADTAVVIRHVAAEHQCAGFYRHPEDQHGEWHWGVCAGCGQPWPCERWLWAQHLGIQFLGRAADRYIARGRAAIARRSRKEAA